MSSRFANLWPLARLALREQARILPWFDAGDSAPSSTDGSDGMYGGHYFGAGRRRAGRAGQSGYPHYSRKSSRAEVAAFLLWKHFRGTTALDVGCALGFVVEALREIGLDAKGCDASSYAIEHPAAGARGQLVQASLEDRLPFDDARFELVSAFEVLEHLTPAAVPHALAELRRVTKGYLVATIPSFGPNPGGLDGIYEGKIRPERLDHYCALPPTYDGPVPEADLARDREGRPVEGHLTIASYAWWTRAFEAAGFEPCPEIARRMLPDLERFGRSGTWCLYVFRVPGAEVSAQPREGQEVEALERAWGLDALSLALILRWELARSLGPAFPTVQRLLKAQAIRVSRWTARLKSVVEGGRG